MNDDGLQRLLDAAEAHGRLSEADHEVGDLQEVVTACWKRLSDAARAEVLRECADVLAWLDEE